MLALTRSVLGLSLSTWVVRNKTVQSQNLWDSPYTAIASRSGKKRLLAPIS